MKLLSVVAVALTLSACGAEEKVVQNAAAKPAEQTPAVVAAREKYYSIKDGQEYGYEQAVSQDAANQGQVATKLMMIKYVGSRGNVIQFYTKDGAFVSVFQCERPCEYVKQMIFYNGALQRKEHIRAVEGSLAWAIIQDALNGRLEEFVGSRNGKPHELWFDETGPKWTPVASSS